MSTVTVLARAAMGILLLVRKSILANRIENLKIAQIDMIEAKYQAPIIIANMYWHDMLYFRFKLCSS